MKIVTDSSSDIPPATARELGITVVPLHVEFAGKSYLDGVDLDVDEFYGKLLSEPTAPKTSAPSAAVFANTYDRLARETDEIVSLHISSKLSATYGAAVAGRQAMRTSCTVEVLDSRSASIALGLLAIEVAKVALAGARLGETKRMLERDIPRTHQFGFLDTLEYLYKGGRIGRVQCFLGSMLDVKPVLFLGQGEVYPMHRVRSAARALDSLCRLVEGFHSINEMAVAHTTAPEGLQALVERLSCIFPEERLYRVRSGATIGTHVGPRAATVALIQGET